MIKSNAELLDAVAVALTKEFEKRYPIRDFSISTGKFDGQPKKMHGSLTLLRKPDGSMNKLAVARITRRAIIALKMLKGKRRL